MKRKFKTMDANEAVANVAYRASEVIAIYPITPSSPMGEWADQWSSENVPNAWGSVPHVVEMQSEGGAAGAVHGALQTGSLSTTFKNRSKFTNDFGLGSTSDCKPGSFIADPMRSRLNCTSPIP